MHVRTSLTVILSAGIAFSLMIGVSGCSTADDANQTLSSSSTLETTADQQAVHTSDNQFGMAEADLIAMFADAGFDAQHVGALDAYTDNIPQGWVCVAQFAADKASTVYYGLSKGSETDRLEEVYADFEAWKATEIISANESYQQNPWYSEYWTITGIDATLNVDDLDNPYYEDVHYYFSTPEGIETRDDNIIQLTIYDIDSFGSGPAWDGIHLEGQQWCMQRTDSEGTDYLRSTDYVESYGIVDIAYYEYYSSSWYVADDGQPIIWSINIGWEIPDAWANADPWEPLQWG